MPEQLDCEALHLSQAAARNLWLLDNVGKLYLDHSVSDLIQ